MRRLVAAAFVAALAFPAGAGAQGVPAVPIPQDPRDDPEPFIGAPAAADPVASPDPPRHPFMAPNGRSNLHVDAYQTDVHQVAGPLGRDMEARSTFLEGVCASVTFDSRGRIVTICVGLEGPELGMLDPRTLELLAAHPLPARMPGTQSIFNDFAGGGYFYLDHLDRAVIPTTNRQLWVVRVTEEPGFRLERVHETGVAPPDKIISALPDWSGRLWFASVDGIVGTIDPDSGEVRRLDTGEEIANSFAVDETGGVYLVTEAALYRLDAGADGAPRVAWRVEYENSGVAKPGQVHAGSGTTPTVMGADLVAITDNADPMNVVVYERAGGTEVCRVPVFEQGRARPTSR